MSDKYRETGVGLEVGYRSIRLIESHATRTKVRGAIDSTGAFGGMFDLPILNMKEPVLISGTNGVGTGLLVAFEMDKYDTVGIDTVTICVGDALVQETAPIFLLDYLAIGKNEPKKIKRLVKGVADDCVQVECALIGGETAEMPDIHDVEHHDIAGFCAGAVDKCNLLDGRRIEEDNVLIGLLSTGVHSSGFSLTHRILLRDAKLDLHKEYGEVGNQKLGDMLLIPTKIYIKAVKHLLGKVGIKGMSHITGSGFYENVPRMLKEGQGVTTGTAAYPHKSVFDMITKYGNVLMDEMCDVFNMGISFMIAVNRKDADTVQSLLREIYEEPYIIGEATGSRDVDVRR